MGIFLKFCALNCRTQDLGTLERVPTEHFIISCAVCRGDSWAQMMRGFARSLPKKYIGLIDYFAFRPARSYAQHGEDIIAYNYFNYHGPRKGIYVDIGCFHPKRHSTTFLLHKQGWHGLNIDVDSYKIDVFKVFRPRDINVSVAVSDQRGWRTYFSKISPSTAQ
jgi:hypothetical protein